MFNIQYIVKAYKQRANNFISNESFQNVNKLSIIANIDIYVCCFYLKLEIYREL